MPKAVPKIESKTIARDGLKSPPKNVAVTEKFKCLVETNHAFKNLDRYFVTIPHTNTPLGNWMFYSRTIIARISVGRLPWLIQTRF